MQFAFTPEQEMTRETVPAFSEEHDAAERVRHPTESTDGFDRDNWRARRGTRLVVAVASA